MWIAAGPTATAVFTVWSLIACPASNVTRGAERSDARVTVTGLPDAHRFVPAANARDDAGLRFIVTLPPG